MTTHVTWWQGCMTMQSACRCARLYRREQFQSSIKVCESFPLCVRVVTEFEIGMSVNLRSQILTVLFSRVNIDRD